MPKRVRPPAAATPPADHNFTPVITCQCGLLDRVRKKQLPITPETHSSPRHRQDPGSVLRRPRQLSDHPEPVEVTRPARGAGRGRTKRRGLLQMIPFRTGAGTGRPHACSPPLYPHTPGRRGRSS
jgi:hypothetical protein